MSQDTTLTLLDIINQIATKTKGLTGNLSSLTTTDKSNLVSALNEIKSAMVTTPQVQNLIDNGINQLIANAPETLNTLGEIATFVNNNKSMIDSIFTKAVRFDITQSLTEPQITQAQINLGLGNLRNFDGISLVNAAFSAP